jgi:CRISPR-associated protein Cas4
MMMLYVSDLSSYCFCPRSIYLSRFLKIKPASSAAQSRGLISHAVRKELSIRQPRILEKISSDCDIRPRLEFEVERILRDVPHIYRSILSGIEPAPYLAEIRSELVSEMLLMEEKLRIMVEGIGLEESIRLLTPKWVEYSVKSDALMLSGRIDKVMAEPSYVPVEIKTGSVPSSVWEGDRIQTCAYAMLLEDSLTLSEPIGFGFVEYTRVSERRPVLTTEKLRREVVSIRDRVSEVLDGHLPDICPHGSGKKCVGCGYKEQCYDI